MAVGAITIVASILSAGGGFTVGFLARQKEINKLQAQVECLQNELEKSQKLAKEFSTDIELIRLQIKIKDNEELIRIINEKKYKKGEVLYAYGLYEYLDLKLKYVLENYELNEKEAIFIDSFVKVLNDKIPDGNEGNALKKTIKEYLTNRYQTRVDNNDVPDFDLLVSKINAALDGCNYQEDENILPVLDCLTLTEEQFRMMYSLERLKIMYDINLTRKITSQRLKEDWLDLWEKSIIKSIGVEDKEKYFIREIDFYGCLSKLLKESDNANWYYIMAMEATLFVPYMPFREEDEKAKVWSKIKLEKEYMQDIFLDRQKVVDGEFLDKIRKYYNSSLNKLNGNFIPRIILPIGISALIAVATGGLGSFLAPEIAVYLVGGKFVGLYGQALVNASLAYLGGGALAAGGAGMAGGTVLITGGASVLGNLAGGAAGRLTSALIDTDPQLILRECAKLITSTSVILLEKNREFTLVEHLCGEIEKKKKANYHQCQILKAQLKTAEKSKKKSLQDSIDKMQDSYKYLDKTEKILEKKKEKVKQKDEQENVAKNDKTPLLINLSESNIKLLIPENYERIKHRNPLKEVIDRKQNNYILLKKSVETSANVLAIFKTTPDKAMDFSDVQGLVDGIHSSLADNQGLIEVNAGKTRRGYDYIYSIVKTLKDNFAGVEYYLRMNIRNGDEIIEINADFDEQGMTGMRESTAMNLAMNAGLISHGEDGKIQGWSEDPYDATYTKGIPMNLAERSGLDGLFPYNPLSQARELLLALINDEYVIVKKESPDEEKTSEDKNEAEEKSEEEKREEAKEFYLKLFSKVPKVCRRTYEVQGIV